MIKIRQKTFFLTLLLSFTLGFFTSFFIFDALKSFSSKSDPAVVKAKELKNEAIAKNASYQRQVETLIHQNAELQQQLERNREVLNQVRQQVKEKEDNLKKILKPKLEIFTEALFPKKFPSKNLAINQFNKKTNIGGTGNLFIPINTENKTGLCDSLAKEVTEYIQANHRKDSIYELQLLHFESLLTQKDAVIQITGGAYNNLQLLFDKSMENQSMLQNQNLACLSKYKRQKFKTKFVTGAFLVLSGITASYMILH